VKTTRPTHKKCRGCGEWFSLKKYARPTQRFCSVSCFASWRNAQPKWRKAHSEKIKAQTDPKVMRERSLAAWRDPAVRVLLTAIRTKQSHTKEARAQVAALNKKIWADPEFRKRHVARSRRAAAELWRDPVYRKKISALMVEENKKRWADPDYKETTSRSIRIALAQPLEKKRRSEQARKHNQRRR